MRQALGKGIGALIPGSASRRPPQAPGAGEGPAQAILIPLSAVVANPRQPRSRFPDEALRELADSIRASGVLQPILVRSLPDGRYELIAGERRTRAARLAGLEAIPAVVRDATADESLVLAIVENLQRADLSPLEEASAFQALMSEFGLTQEQVATQVGRSRPAVANSIRLLQLPVDVQERLASGELTAGHARALLSIDGDRARSTLAREIVHRRLSVRDAERETERLRSASRPRSAGARVPAHSADLRALETDLTRALGRKARVRAGAQGKGEVVLEYYSDDDLAALADRLVGGPGRPGGR